MTALPQDTDWTADASRPAQARIEREAHKLEKRLCREVGRAIVDYRMIEEGDKVMVCMSGGKDSYTLLDILIKLQKRAPIHFDLVAVNLDQKQPGFPEHILPEYLAATGVPFHIENQDTYSIVKRVVPEGKTTCGLCSRLRRGILYRVADELGCTKIALGHHRDDILQTLLLNMFFGGKMKAMPPKLVSDDGRHVVIRPLAYVPEKDTTRWAQQRQFPIIPCNLCGSQGEPAAQAGGRDAARLGQALPRPRGQHVQRAAEHRAVAPDGWNAARLPASEGHGHRERRRRQGLRRRGVPRRPPCRACRWCRFPDTPRPSERPVKPSPSYRIPGDRP